MTQSFTKVATMNKELVCPFCQQELLLSSFRDGDKDNEIWNCLHCQIGGKRKLWQELIRTRKALDRAKWWLNEIVENHRYTPISTAEMALKEITALEQKE